LQEASVEMFALELSGDDELELLMSLLGIKLSPPTLTFQSAEFSALFDYSCDLLPELDQKAFDGLYEKWLSQTGRNSSMDEYGQLLFLQGRASAWNRMSGRFILREKP
jgi:hypothetical protein